MAHRFSRGFVLGAMLSLVAHAQTTDEYRVKAAFLFNFAKFVEWPALAFKSPTDPIAICVLGKNPFGNGLAQTVSGKVVDGRSFSVLQVAEASQAKLCHILFVSGLDRKRLRSILSDLKGACTLTVGETEEFIEEGGVVNFKIQGGNVRLQISVDTAAQQQLHISSKLLSLAEIVRKDR